MTGLARMALDGGGWILVEAPTSVAGPVKAGRVDEAIRELPANLRTAMVPVTDAARVVLDQLRQAGPEKVAVEFGVDLAVQAGAVITKGEAGCHLKVTLTWARGDHDGDEG